jgi:hypothetical protein
MNHIKSLVYNFIIEYFFLNKFYNSLNKYKNQQARKPENIRKVIKLLNKLEKKKNY